MKKVFSAIGLLFFLLGLGGMDGNVLISSIMALLGLALMYFTTKGEINDTL
jgi:hypothetical protein